MRVYISIPEVLALLEIVDEHIQRNFPGVEPPLALRKVRGKFGRAVAQHRDQIAATIKASRTMATKGGASASRRLATSAGAGKRPSGRS
ncbi:MAG TPA: hypothetical protein VFY29_07450 [Terriglobia bacterium]|nr:hypothetical protein [Terriglobia bacterium]